MRHSIRELLDNLPKDLVASSITRLTAVAWPVAMQAVTVRFGCVLWLVAALAVSGSEQSAASTRDTAPPVVARELIYAAQNDGTIHVYDIDDHHAEVKVI